MPEVYAVICEQSLKYDLTYGRCGKCYACRVDKVQEWSARMLFESYMHDSNLFVTLTYDEEHVPYVETDPTERTLRKRDCQLFLKRLRKRLDRKDDGRKIRYFMSGEYGENFTQRPHYHAILFGCSLLDGKEIAEAWNKGNVQCAEANTNRIRYTAKYIQKKIINQMEPNYPDGRCSEFALMSRMPGLGSGFLAAMASSLVRQAGNPDVSLAGLARVDGRKYPLDRYGRNLLITTLVDMGVSWRDAERLVRNQKREGDSPDGLDAEFKARSKMDRQNKQKRAALGREKVFRHGSNRVH